MKEKRKLYPTIEVWNISPQNTNYLLINLEVQNTYQSTL